MTVNYLNRLDLLKLINNLASGIWFNDKQKSESSTSCVPCLLGKQTRLPFPKKELTRLGIVADENEDGSTSASGDNLDTTTSTGEQNLAENSINAVELELRRSARNNRQNHETINSA
ncbi:hypothetical protein Bhyg_00723 [Pseudolycoriella hygida]|uniref:Uncharacterized protein n=1 Tax=Pseudolycoriella hygida TaxID=35572 RepID=A0A9Q0S4V0_9DIPT|nr:hypothetical protein Bhyg_00723 [Pseudolycoriella hygida]